MAKRKLVHFEIPAHDRRAAAAFYGDLFDWTFEHTDEPAPYTVVSTGNVAGGLPDVGEQYQPGGVLIYPHSAPPESKTGINRCSSGYGIL